VIGSTLLELLHPELVPSRRFGEKEDRRRRLAARGLTILTAVLGVLYLAWTLGALNRDHPMMGALFFGAEFTSLALFVLAAWDAWLMRYTDPQGMPASEGRSVDIFVTACGEPLHVVSRTLEAAAAIEWDGPITRYVLDDGGSQAVRKVSERLGFRYLSRNVEGLPPSDAKGGNLNFGLSRSEGDLILVLDADQIADRQILNTIAGFMQIPLIAFVQTKQRYLVPREDPFNNQDSVFYDAVQIGFNAGDTVISCGSGVLYRRVALEDIGGFATWNLVEDLTTSYELHSRGWKSMYYGYPLTVGLSPSDIWGVYQQRGQWALDTMRLFFWDNPLRKKGLSRRSRLTYSVIGLSYVCAAFVFPFFFVLPLWSYLTGDAVLDQPGWEFLAVRTPYLISMSLALQYLFRAQAVGKQFQLYSGLFPVYARAIVRALFHPPGRKPGYKTNNATARRKRRYPAWVAVLPQMSLFVANAVLPFYAVLQRTAPGWLIAANAFVSVFALWALWQVLAAALGPKRWDVESDPQFVYRTLDLEDGSALEPVNAA
jgi:cellulose synthase (UDP-forming)